MTTGTATSIETSAPLTARMSELALAARTIGADKVPITFSNPRVHSGLSVAEIKDLAEDIAGRGLQAPILVRPVIFDGRTVRVVVDGQRRFRALEYLKKNSQLASEDILVRDTHEPTEFTTAVAAEMLDSALAIGTKREGLSSYELVNAAVHLRGAGKTNEEIGKSIGRSASWVSRFLAAYTSATQEVLSSWRNGKITDEQFKDLAKGAKAQQEETLAEVIKLRDSGDREAVAEARATAKLSAPAPTPREAKAATPPKNGSKGHAAAAPVPAVKAKGDAKAEAPAPPKPAKPSTARLAEFVELRRQSPSREPYIRGLQDMAAFALGEISEDAFSPVYRTYVKAIAKAHTKPAPAKAPTAGADKAKGAEAKAKAPKKKHGDKAKAVAKGKPKKRGK